jgi:uncharacterized protein YkwD
MTKKRIAVIAAVLAAAAVPGAAPAHASNATEMVGQMNAARAAHGIGPLRMSDRINRSSYHWARFLMRHAWLGHASLRAARVKGEIIEKHGGRRAKVRGAIRGWMGSPEHRAIVLTPRFHVVGVGTTSGRFGSKRSTIWVARFK